MNGEFIQSFLSHLDSNTLVRIKIISSTINKLSKFDTIFKYKSIQKIYNQSSFGKRFLDTFEDLSKFNIHKMKPDGLVIKTITNIKPFYTFLNKNSDKIEKGLKWIVKFDEYTSFTTLLSKVAPYAKKVSIGLTIFGAGQNLYKNYKETKSVTKSLIGTIIDEISNIGVLEGIAYGSVCGPKGMVIGAVAGGIIQGVKFVVPKMFSVVKNYMYQKIDQIKLFFKPKTVSVSKPETTFELHKEVLEQRIQFYQQLVDKLNRLLQILQNFQHNFNDYATGVSASTIKEIKLQQLINKVSNIIHKNITPTLNGIKHYQKEGEYLFMLYHYANEEKLSFIKVDYAKMRQSLKEMLDLNMVISRIHHQLLLFNDDIKIQNLHYKLSQNQKINLETYRSNQKLLREILMVEGKNYYAI